MYSEFNEKKLERIESMPVFAAKMKYERLKMQIEIGVQKRR